MAGKLLIVLSVFLLLPVSGAVVQAAQLEKITIAGPMAVVTYPMLAMIEHGQFDKIAKEVDVKIWQTPDQLRAMIIGGTADFTAVPTNTAAMFYNKGADIKLLNVSVWGILFMVSRDDNLKTLADFKGKEIAMPFKGDMPHIIFSEIARKEGLDPQKDFNLRYVASPMDAVQLMVLRRVDHALLAEPAVSMLLHKAKNHMLIKLVAPELFRSVDLQEEWGRVFETDSEVPQAGIAALKGINKNKEVLAIFQEEYAKALTWCNEHPEETGKIVEKYIDGLKASAVAVATTNTRLIYRTATESKEKLVQLFSVLNENAPKKIGGRMPDDAFYEE
ncbi:MAG TPA: ABC transporter substrate-binding protein [Desulfocapsa sulfexigens]|nr:ABC transporter substrate-binding protein [Desulfocapsa sulfexigens]